MPTGYTATLMEKGQTFDEFVMTCARAFVACVMMRDEPMDKPIQKREPSPFYKQHVDDAKALLVRLDEMGGTERVQYGEKLRDEAITRYQGYLQKDREQNERLSDMRSRVVMWTPPTVDHQALHTFMLQQIDLSKSGTDYWESEIAKASAMSPADYYAAAVKKARRDIDYYAEEYAKEVTRANESNAWIDALRESLNSTDAAAVPDEATTSLNKT
jgi:hypothetical protein